MLIATSVITFKGVTKLDTLYVEQFFSMFCDNLQHIFPLTINPSNEECTQKCHVLYWAKGIGNAAQDEHGSRSIPAEM